jgi:hypothetical protein
MYQGQKPPPADDGVSGPPPNSSSGGAAGGGTGTSHSSSSSSSQQYHTYEERLSKSWRNMVSSIVTAFQKAEKAAVETTKENLKEVDEAVVIFIRFRLEYHRLISIVEARLQGKAQEMEALNNYVRTQPRLGKRKRDDVVEAILAAKSQDDVVVVVPELEPATETKIAPDPNAG